MPQLLKDEVLPGGGTGDATGADPVGTGGGSNGYDIVLLWARGEVQYASLPSLPPEDGFAYGPFKFQFINKDITGRYCYIQLASGKVGK